MTYIEVRTFWFLWAVQNFILISFSPKIKISQHCHLLYENILTRTFLICDFSPFFFFFLIILNTDTSHLSNAKHLLGDHLFCTTFFKSQLISKFDFGVFKALNLPNSKLFFFPLRELILCLTPEWSSSNFYHLFHNREILGAPIKTNDTLLTLISFWG